MHSCINWSEPDGTRKLVNILEKTMYIYCHVCDNHRGISLLSIAGKILAKILLNCLNAHLDQAGLIPDSKCGFRKDKGTIDMIFTARQLQEKCQEQNVDLYMTFVDLTKAFETVSRDGI